MVRSVNVELDLEEGDYQVRVKVTAYRYAKLLPIDQVIRGNARSRREKLIRVGLAYDLAHGKGKFVETAEETEAREYKAKKERDQQKDEVRKKILDGREQAYYVRKKQLQRDRRRINKSKTRAKAKEKQNTLSDQGNHRGMLLDGSAYEAEDEEAEGLDEDKQGSHESGSVNGNGKSARPEKQKPSVSFAIDDDSSPWDEDVGSLESLSDLSDREMDMQVEAYLSALDKPAPNSQPNEQNEELDEFEKDPWNAAVVVGLRVYHKIAEEDMDKDIVKVKVVRPHLLTGLDEDVSESERKGQGLDVDDSSKDATLEGSVKERKASIVGHPLGSG